MNYAMKYHKMPRKTIIIEDLKFQKDSYQIIFNVFN